MIMKNFRRWLAKKLCPDVFQNERSYNMLRSELADAYWWLYGYPDAADTIRWVLDNNHNRNRPIGHPAIGEFPANIADFRNHLESRMTLPPETPMSVPEGMVLVPIEPTSAQILAAEQVLFEKENVANDKTKDAGFVNVDFGNLFRRSYAAMIEHRPPERKFALGQKVKKIKGSMWSGRIVGFYSTTLTPVGYNVESFTERGSVQLYPESALEAI